ncbi:MAG TPA: response regulator transcription factor [Miltoncostaea sp.]|nr:response regulator transcription factor [Miltoncostaea sp.]
MHGTSDGGAAARILVVEDEAAIADAIRFGLANEGWAVEVVNDGQAAADADPDAFDLVMLDLNLPGVPGFEVCRRIRARSAVPIIILTARVGEGDRVLGLEFGADDYVVKPFSMPELVSRVRANLRRRELDRGEAGAERRVGDLRLDLVERAVTIAGRPVDLTPSEFLMLAFLAERPGRAVGRREILERIWRSEYIADERLCDTHVKNVRRKIEDDPARPERLVTVRGVGYMLRSP